MWVNYFQEVKMPKGVYPRTPEHNANNSAARKKYYQKNPGAAKKWNSTAEAKANFGAAQLKYYKEHPEAHAKTGKAVQKARNSPEVLTLIEQFSSPFINLLRGKYANLNSRCNDPNNHAYHNYGGRGIENEFTSPEHFLHYVIFRMHITTIEQIEGLEIHRGPNINDNYAPGNIEFLTPKEHHARHPR